MSQSADSLFSCVATGFRLENIPHVLIGGFAVNFYQVSRNTEDIDFQIAADDFEKASIVLQKSGYKRIDKQENFARFQERSKFLMDLDLVFVDRTTLGKIIEESGKTSIGVFDLDVYTATALPRGSPCKMRRLCVRSGQASTMRIKSTTTL